MEFLEREVRRILSQQWTLKCSINIWVWNTPTSKIISSKSYLMWKLCYIRKNHVHCWAYFKDSSGLYPSNSRGLTLYQPPSLLFTSFSLEKDFKLHKICSGEKGRVRGQESKNPPNHGSFSARREVFESRKPRMGLRGNPVAEAGNPHSLRIFSGSLSLAASFLLHKKQYQKSINK